MRYRKNVGDIGEDFAAKLLENSGFRILERSRRDRYHSDKRRRPAFR